MSPRFLSLVKNDRFHYFVALSIAVVGIGLMVSLCMRSNGMPVQDEIAHYTFSRQAWKSPELMLNTWGRPLNTIVYMLPALHSWLTARFFSIFLSTISLILTILTARKLQVKALFLIPVLLLFQPWFHELGFTVITEVPFCLALIAGAYFLVSEKYGLASLCIGSLVLIRHEGIALLGVWGLWMVLKKKWVPFAITVTPYLLYSAIYIVVFAKPAFEIFTSLQPTEMYGSGSWLHFVKPTLKETAVLPVILSLFSIPSVIRLREKGIIVLLCGIYFLTHTIIYRFGLFASGGYILFLMPLSAGFALAGAMGVENLLAGLRYVGRKLHLEAVAMAAGFVLIVAVCGVMLAAARNSEPYLMSDEEIALREAYEYIHAEGVVPEMVYSTHAYFNYLYDLPMANWLYQPDLMGMKEHSIVVWERHYADRWGVSYARLTDPTASFRLRKSFADGHVVVFEKIIP